MALKILTNIRFAQTAGIAQTLSAFLDFLKKNKKNSIQVVGVNILSRPKSFYRKNKKGNISIISSSINIPNIKKAVESSRSIKDIEKKYSRVINIYRKAIKCTRLWYTLQYEAIKTCCKMNQLEVG